MIDRRSALLAAIRLVGGMVTLASLPAGAYTGTQAAPGGAGRFFTADELRLLADVAEMMIPATDTPGARAANVQGVIDGLMVDWAVPETQATIHTALADIDRAAGAGGLSALSPADALSFLTLYDARAFADRALPASAPYRLLKRLIFHAYFTSEGADPDYVAVPGTYRGDIDLTEYRQLVAERQ